MGYAQRLLPRGTDKAVPIYIYALEAGVRVINFDTPARSAWNSLISDLCLLISHS